MQPVRSLESLVLIEMARDPLNYLDKISDDLAVKLCEVSDPDVVLPYLVETNRRLRLSEKLRLALNLHREVNDRKQDYETLSNAGVILASSPPSNILIECNMRVAKVSSTSLEVLRKYNALVDELKEGYLE